MPDVRELLERESTSVDLEPGHFDRLLGRRDRKRRNQRIRAGVLALALALLTFAALARAFRSSERTADEPHPPTFTGTVIRYTGEVYGRPGDLVAEDPSTGEMITLVDAASELLADDIIAWAAVSHDGRWVAFEGSFCKDPRAEDNGGLWISSGIGAPRQLTAPCPGSEGRLAGEGRWAWSPIGSQLAVVVRSSGGAQALTLIDPATGDRTDLGETAGDVTSLAWSPDGTRIAYATVPTGSPNGNSPNGTVYAVSVEGGEHALIAESIGQVPGGEEGSGIAWSPDGARIAVLADPDPDHGIPRGTLDVMNADGSDRRPVDEGVLIEHVLGSPNVAWSPGGTRIAYATMSGDREHLRIWSASLDGSAPILVFDAGETGRINGSTGGPVWSPDGGRIAFRSPTDEEKVWLVANADGTGNVHEIDELRPLSWRGGWYFCECYG